MVTIALWEGYYPKSYHLYDICYLNIQYLQAILLPPGNDHISHLGKKVHHGTQKCPAFKAHAATAIRHWKVCICLKISPKRGKQNLGKLLERDGNLEGLISLWIYVYVSIYIEKNVNACICYIDRRCTVKMDAL